MQRTLYFLFLIMLSIVLNAEPIDSISTRLNTMPADQQYDYLVNLKYKLLVTKNQELIPIFLNYIEKAQRESKLHYLAQLYERLSLMYYFNGKYDKDFEYGLKAIQLFDSLGEYVSLGNIYGELGYRMKRRDLMKAFKLMRRGKSILERENDPAMLAKIYDNYGVLHEMNNRLDSAIFYYNKALKIKMRLNDSIGIPYSLCNIFMAFSLYGKMDSAKYYLDKATRIRKLTKDPVGLTECYSYYGNYFMKINQPDRGLEYFFKTLDNALKFNYPDLAGQMYKDISKIYEQNNKPGAALKYYKLFKQYHDSLVNAETNKTMADLQVKFETAEKEKEIQKQSLELQSKSIQLLLLLGLIVLVVITFILIYSRYRQKQKLIMQEKLNEEKRLRFIEVIETEEKERTRVARELHDGLGQLLSTAKINMAGLDEVVPQDEKYLLDNSLQLIDQSVSEVRAISHDLMPVSLMRYGLKASIEEMAKRINDSGKIKFICDLDNIRTRMPENTERTIYRLVQEIINNIIKHARAGIIYIKMTVDRSGEVSITVKNDGIVFDLSMLQQSTGIGWKNIFARVNMLKGEIEIVPGESSGTQILINFKV